MYGCEDAAGDRPSHSALVGKIKFVVDRGLKGSGANALDDSRPPLFAQPPRDFRTLDKLQVVRFGHQTKATPWLCLAFTQARRPTFRDRHEHVVIDMLPAAQSRISGLYKSPPISPPRAGQDGAGIPPARQPARRVAKLGARPRPENADTPFAPAYAPQKHKQL